MDRHLYRHRNRTLVALTLAALLVLPLFAAPAAADSGWIFGTRFRIGDVFFHIGYQSHGSYGRGGPAYYYRTRVDLGRRYYGRAHHNRGCYESGGYYYHGQHCPLVQAYFSHNGYRDHDVFDRYAPSYGHSYGDGYRRYDGGYSDHSYGDGYYDRHRNYRDRYRYDRRHHRRHHRHHRGCGHGGY